MIICENPIHSLKLLNKLGIKKKLLSLHDYNEDLLIKRIENFQKNYAIALISDAGSPLISDPGYKLVLDYISKNIKITTIPGPSAIISALQLSGLPLHNFTFLGFLSKNTSTIKSTVNQIKNSPVTIVLFVSGNRLLFFLNEIYKQKINNKIAVCKEITKKNEYIFRGSSQKIITEIESKNKALKGEFVFVIQGKEKKVSTVIIEETKQQIQRLLLKFSLTEVVEIVHKLTGISKKEIYKTALIIKND